MKRLFKRILATVLLTAVFFGMWFGLRLFAEQRAVREWTVHIDETLDGVGETYDAMKSLGTTANDFCNSIFQVCTNLMGDILKDNPNITAEILENLRLDFALDNVYLVTMRGTILSKSNSADWYMSQEDFYGVFETILAGGPLKKSFTQSVTLEDGRSASLDFTQLDESRYLVSVVDAAKTDAVMDLFSLERMGQSETQTKDEFDILAKRNRIYYIGKPLEETGTPSDFGIEGLFLVDGWKGTFNYNGERYYAGCRVFRGGEACVHACSETLIKADARFFVAMMMLALAMSAFLVCTYARWIRKTEFIKGRPHVKRALRFGPGCDLTIFRMVRPIVVIAMALIMLLSGGLQMVLDVPQRMIQNDSSVKVLDANYKMLGAVRQRLNTVIENAFIDKVKALEYMLRTSSNGEYDAKQLTRLSKLLQVDAIMIFDQHGNLIATDSQYSGLTIGSAYSGSPGAAFASLLKGGDPVIGPSIIDKDNAKQKNVGISLRDANGDVTGAALICVNTEILARLDASMNLQSLLQFFPLDANSFLFSVDTASGLVDYTTLEAIRGYDISQLGLESTHLNGVFNGILRMGGEEHVVASTRLEEKAIFMASNHVYAGNDLLAVVTTLPLWLYLCILCAVSIIVPRSEATVGRRDPNAPDNADPNYIAVGNLNDLFSDLCDTAAKRGSHRTAFAEFSKHSPKRRMKALSRGLLIGYVLGTYSLFLLLRAPYAEIQVWQQLKSVNILTITHCVIIATYASLAANALRLTLKLFSGSMGARANTIAHMLRSCVSYFAFLVGLFLCLGTLGVNTSSILTSMGVISIVVGIGSQKLIGDFVGGLFIIFESNFRVGDIVMINTTYGVVKEVGLRTIQVVTRDNNIVIINNSAINLVTNLSHYGSSVYIDIGVAPQTDLDLLEVLFREEFERIRAEKRIPTITWGPIYLGVSAIAGAKTTVSISAGCDERYKNETTRCLNREIKRLLQENNITIV